MMAGLILLPGDQKTASKWVTGIGGLIVGALFGMFTRSNFGDLIVPIAITFFGVTGFYFGYGAVHGIQVVRIAALSGDGGPLMGRMWVSTKHLKDYGMLGMNCRNVDFINRYNDRKLFPLVDNKLKTKLLAQEYDVPTPALKFVVR